ncbi:DUF4340 domain-containing protein [Tautonia sociabilis]|uniref:DUF4340 domain-containing protein n=1 Tax=Tautonia sociabilis TaxID=2080755 RepID=A0A432MHE0_9BACT|nr:DUF4340 domain-containing protein [Tautonia sociabilis]RUL86470.1 DUF4340 domain-containing protein [Tautonia sociabilis]
MMGKRSTLFLLVLFFGGLGALWWARWANVPTAAERAEMAVRVLPALMAVETSEIARVEVEQPGEHGGRVVLERTGPDRWQVAEPIEARADARRIETLLNNLKALRRAPEAGDVAGDPDRFGLDPPARVVRLYREGESEPVAALELGDELERLRYVRPEGGSVTLADALRLEPDDVDPGAWRDRALFNIYSYDVKSLDVAGPGRRLAVELDRGRWRVVAPFRAPANAEAINGLLADLAELEAVAGPEGFAAEDVEDLSPFGLDPPRATITLVPAGLTGPDAPQVAHLGAAPEGKADLLYARRDGEDDVLLVRARGVADVGLDPQAMRSRKVVDFRPAEVAALEIEADGRTYRLLRGDEGWRVVSPEEGPADAIDVATLLETLTGLESAAFFPIEEVEDAEIDAPRAAFAAWLDDGEQDAGSADGVFDRPADVRLAVGRYDAGKKLVYGQLEGDEGTVLALPETVRDVVPDGALAYRDRTMVRQDPRAVRRVELSRIGRSIALERMEPAPGLPSSASSSAWRVVEPTRAPADRLAVTMLVDALTRLRAERRIEAEGDASAAFGMDRPAVRVSWLSGQGERESRTTLLVGDPVPGRDGERYATLEGEPGLFTIGPKLLAIMAAEFRERRLLAFPADRADRVAVRGPEGEVAFVRGDSGGWEPEGDGASWPPGFGADRVEAMVTALSTLVADRIAQDDGPMPEGSGLEPPIRAVEVRIRGLEGEEEQSATVRLGAVVDGVRYAAMGAEGPGAVFLLKADAVPLPPIGGGAGERPSASGELPEDPFQR